jgi:hypothetical protein
VKQGAAASFCARSCSILQPAGVKVLEEQERRQVRHAHECHIALSLNDALQNAHALTDMATEKAIGSKQKIISSLIIITKPASHDFTRPHLLYLWVPL